MFNVPIAFFQNLSTPEILIILFVVVLLFGSKKLPDLSRAVGRSIGEFKKGRQELDNEIKEAEKAVSDEEEKKESSNL